jgi:hypothetical protein
MPNAGWSYSRDTRRLLAFPDTASTDTRAGMHVLCEILLTAFRERASAEPWEDLG